MKTKWLSEISYDQGLIEQQEAFELVRANKDAIVLGLEHTPVITLGRRLSLKDNTKKINTDSNKSLVNKISVTDINGDIQELEVSSSDRGGEATLHSPGQLVVYPVCPIREWNMSVRDYVCWLERSMKHTCKHYGIETHSKQGESGVYSSSGKIGFVGIRVRNGITQHGLSFNVSNDLSLFKAIKPCGHTTLPLDSLKLHSIDATPKEVFEILSHYMIELFPLTATREVSEIRCSDARP